MAEYPKYEVFIVKKQKCTVKVKYLQYTVSLNSTLTGSQPSLASNHGLKFLPFLSEFELSL